MSESRNLDNIFSDRLKSAREMREMTQAELAAKTGLQPSAIAHFEGNRRKPSFDNIRVLSRALNVSSDFLMGADEDQQLTVFRNEEKLSYKDRDIIQDMINLMIAKKDGG